MSQVCRFCGEEPDGDRSCFVDAKRTRCNRTRCIIAWEQEWSAYCRRGEQQDRAMRALRRKDAQRRGKRRVYRRAA
jgi:hypothetical protein